MNLYSLLQKRLETKGPVTVGLIGAGKFGSMFLAQAAKTKGLEVAVIADLSPDRAKAACRATGWDDGLIGRTEFTDDAFAMIASDKVEVVVDATGAPSAGIAHALAAAKNGKHIVMVNVEADVLAGPLLAKAHDDAGTVYTMAYGDQPALTCEMVDWARACGLEVIAAGKGTKYLPEYHASTPDTIWGYYGMTPEAAKKAGMNPQMFNSFLDGTKSAIEMAAIANATGLTPAPDGLEFPPCGVDDLPHVLRPKAEGGHLHHKGQVEVVSCVERDGRPVFKDLRWGVYVVFGPGGEGVGADYTAACFRQYGMVTDSSGMYGALYKPYHLIGLELGISVLSAVLRGEPTGRTEGFRGDVVATAKRNLKAGEMLDGEGGFTVYGKLMPATDSLALGGLPIGLAHHVKLKNDIKADAPVTWADVEIGDNNEAVQVRRQMEQTFAPSSKAAE